MIKQISKDQAYQILSDTELFNRVSDDGTEYKDFEMPNHLYLGVFNNDELIGFYWLHSDNSTTLNVHCNILEDHRIHAKKSVFAFYEFLIDRV